MKIGILTYQNTLNFGAALQCYALYRTSTELGNETEVINYINSNIEATRNPINILKKDNNVSLKMTVASSFRKYLYNKKIKSFDNFNNKFIKLSNIRYISNDEINDNPPLYDKYIIGSDQVWNYHINGMDKTYFMDFVKDKSKIFTYASSFGLTKIDEKYKSIYKKYLNELHYISVRENEGARLINELVDKEVEIVNDPVFLISKDDWVRLIDTKVTKHKYFCTYFLDHKTRSDFEKNYKNSEKLKWVKLAGGIKISDFINSSVRVNYGNGPLEFIKYINNAEYVFTDSFHATVFSIILGKKFLVFLRGDEGKDSRLINLLKKFNMENRIFSGNMEELYRDVNLLEIEEKCTEFRESGKKYFLKNTILSN